MSSAFRLGLVGAGRMGQNHLSAIDGSESAQVVALAEPNAGTRERLALTGVAIHRDLESMLDREKLDGAIVCVPTDQHLATVARLAEAGIPILCEKPCGMTVAETREAVRLTEAAGIPLQVAYWRRFVPSLRDLRAQISSGQVGGVYLVACYQWDGKPASLGFRAHSGGIFVDMAVHEFDQVRWLTGSEFESIHPVASRIGLEPPVVPGDVESASAIAELTNGTTVFVSLGRRFSLGDVCRVEVYGTAEAHDCRFLWPPDADAAFFDALRRQAESFARYVRGAEREGAGGADAIAALEVAASASSMFAEAATR